MKYTSNNRSYRDSFVEEITEEKVVKIKRPLILNKRKNFLSKLKNNVALFFKM